MKVKDIIEHHDGERIHWEVCYSAETVINVPHKTGKIHNIVPAEFSKTSEELIEYSLFNENNVTRIDLALSKYGLYYLILRQDYMLTEVHFNPDSIKYDFKVYHNPFVPDCKGFIYSFYNLIDSQSITIFAKLVPMDYNLYENLQKDPTNPHVFLDLKDATFLSRKSATDPTISLTFDESFNSDNKLIWKVKDNNAQENRESFQIFDNRLSIAVILILYEYYGGTNKIDTEQLYEHSKNFTKGKKGAKKNALHNIEAAISELLNSRVPPEMTSFIEMFRNIKSNNLSLGKRECQFINKNSIRIIINSPSLNNLKLR